VDPDSPLDQDLATNEESEQKAALGRRLFRRVRRGVPGKFDGDGDGFVYNPASGRDDLPAPRRSMIPRKGKKRRRILASDWSAQNKPMRSRSTDWSNDDGDPLEELQRSLGIGVPNAADRMTAAAREMAERRRQQGAGFSPVEVSRKKVRVDGVSRNTFLNLMDDLIDYTKTLKDDPLEERDNKRVWKLLFVMQKLENLEGIAQSGDGIDLNLSEDELKRLYKGLQSLIDNIGEWSDNTDAQDLYSQIKKLYKRGWDSIGESKSLDADLDFKILGIKLGRRGRRAFRRGRGAVSSARSRIDGDGDGFTTNPITGEDDIPLVDAPDLPKPKKPLSVSDVGMMSMRGRGRMLQTSRNAARQRMMRSESTGDNWLQDMLMQFAQQINGPRSHDQAKEWMFQALGKSKIKQRSWQTFKKRVDVIEKELKDEFGDLATLSDFKNAFQKLNPDVKIKGFDEDLTPKEIGFFKGILFTMKKFPNRYDKASKLRITKRDAGIGTAGGTMVKPKFRASKYGGARVLSGDKVEFEFNEVIDLPYDQRIPPVTFTDGVTNQLMAAYLRENRDQVDPETLMSRAAELSGLGTGIHEGVHGVHYLASHEDALPANMTPQQVMDMIEDLMKNNFDEFYENLMYVKAHDDFMDALLYVGRFQAEGDDVEDQMKEAIQLATNSGDAALAQQLTAMMANRQEAVEFTKAFTKVLAGQEFEDVRASLARGVAGLPDISEDEDAYMSAVQKLINQTLLDNKQTIVDFMEKFHTENMGLGSVDDFRQQLQASVIDGEVGFNQAQMQLTRRKLWDDLTKSEISEIRKVWRYISSYAKDKNSMYGGTTYTASVEGAAEGMLLQILGFGLPEDKLPPEAIAAFNKWMMWLAGKDY
jgi:hypothetical protein